jgi:hypothetical protein
MNELSRLIMRIEAKLRTLGQDKSRLRDDLESLKQAEHRRLEAEKAAEKRYAEDKKAGEHEFDLLRRKLQGEGRSDSKAPR